ncbi:MAG: hypothetical protein H0Z34_06660 [Brevibacillus sp.]|nr:hypothetical protein [Brevibacillus sp.]
MEQLVSRFFQLKELQREVETELEQLRKQIIEFFPDSDVREVGEYRVSVTYQERREYDGDRLFQALPDPAVWKLLSKPDPAKISGLLKLRVIPEQVLVGTYDLRRTPILRVQKR